jgi:hypothetical protein
MGFFDNLFGSASPEPQQQRSPARSDDEIAVERYRYLLRTAPPETIEQVHTEAFATLTPAQRDLLFDELTKNAAAGDAPASKEPQALAVSATRSELRNPGTMERSLGGQGMGFGSMVASSLLGTVAGYVIGSAIVGAFLPDPSTDASADGGGNESSADSGADSGGDVSADGGGFGESSGDFGGDFGDFGF